VTSVCADLSLFCLSPIPISHNFFSHFLCMHVMSLNTKYLVVKWVLSRLKCTKIDFGRGFAPGPTGGAYDAPPDLLVGWGGGHPLPNPHSSPGQADLRVGNPTDMLYLYCVSIYICCQCPVHKTPFFRKWVSSLLMAHQHNISYTLYSAIFRKTEYYSCWFLI